MKLNQKLWMNRWNQSAVFNRDQKMALRTFYFINVHKSLGHITTYGALSAIFCPLLKKTGFLSYLSFQEKIIALGETLLDSFLINM